MNFVIFPLFFVSGSLYPVRELPALLYWAATYFALALDLAVLAVATLARAE
jgi:hypothetical protein